MKRIIDIGIGTRTVAAVTISVNKNSEVIREHSTSSLSDTTSIQVPASYLYK